jgi:hypothetical protein
MSLEPAPTRKSMMGSGGSKRWMPFYTEDTLAAERRAELGKRWEGRSQLSLIFSSG